MLKLEENVVALRTYLSTPSLLQPSALAQKISNHAFDVHGVLHMVHSTFQWCNSWLCPNISNRDNAVIGVNHLVQRICNLSTHVHISWLASWALTGSVHASRDCPDLQCKAAVPYHLSPSSRPLLIVFADLFLSDMHRMHKGPLPLSTAVWAWLDRGKWCGDQMIPKELKQDLDCLKDVQVLPSNVIDGVQSCFEAQACTCQSHASLPSMALNTWTHRIRPSNGIHQQSGLSAVACACGHVACCCPQPCGV